MALVGGVALVLTRSGDDDGTAGWMSEVHGDSSDLVRHGDQVCSTAAGTRLYCLDAATGDELFSEEIGDSLSSPALLGDVLLVGSRGLSMLQRGVGLYAYSLEGEELWYAPADMSQAQQSIPVADGVAAVVDGASLPELVGIDGATGEERWRIVQDPTSALQLTEQVVSDGRQFYVGYYDLDSPTARGWVAALDPTSGTELWRTQLELALSLDGLGDVAPSDDGGRVTMVAQEPGSRRRLLVLDTATGAVVHNTPLLGNHASLVRFGDTTIVADGAELSAHDRDGNLLWTVAVPMADTDPTLTSPANLVDEDGRIYLVGDDVVEIDPATGSGTPVACSVDAQDIVVVEDMLVVSGFRALEARPLSDGCPVTPGARRVTPLESRSADASSASQRAVDSSRSGRTR